MENKEAISKAVNFTSEEKVVLIIFSVLLLIAVITMYVRTNQIRDVKIPITDNGITNELTLKEVVQQLKEQQKIPINTATFDKLTAIPGIGETLAMRIMEYRDKYGLFRSTTDLLNIKGIGEEKLKEIRPNIKLE